MILQLPFSPPKIIANGAGPRIFTSVPLYRDNPEEQIYPRLESGWGKTPFVIVRLPGKHTCLREWDPNGTVGRVFHWNVIREPAIRRSYNPDQIGTGKSSRNISIGFLPPSVPP